MFALLTRQNCSILIKCVCNVPHVRRIQDVKGRIINSQADSMCIIENSNMLWKMNPITLFYIRLRCTFFPSTPWSPFRGISERLPDLSPPSHHIHPTGRRTRSFRSSKSAIARKLPEETDEHPISQKTE